MVRRRALTSSSLTLGRRRAATNNRRADSRQLLDVERLEGQCRLREHELAFGAGNASETVDAVEHDAVRRAEIAHHQAAVAKREFAVPGRDRLVTHAKIAVRRSADDDGRVGEERR